MAARLESLLRPSAYLLSRVASYPTQQALLDRVVKEFEIYEYFSDKVPSHLSDLEWEKSMKEPSIQSRVAYWTFLALTQYKLENDLERKADKNALNASHRRAEEAKFEAGLMGYGFGLHKIYVNPERSNENFAIYEGNKMCTSLRVGDKPEIAIDLGLILNSTVRDAKVMGGQVNVAVSTNYSKAAFPMSLINCNLDDKRMNNFIKRDAQFLQEPTPSSVNRPNCFKFLEKYKGNPYEEDNFYRNKKVVYISRHARKMLEGPLDADVYIIPASMDRSKESVGAVRGKNYDVRCLPIDMYMKWKMGSKAQPLQHIISILSDVCNGDSWRTALYNTIPLRCLVDPEKQSVEQKRFYDSRLEKIEQGNKVAQIIFESLGPPPLTEDI